MIPFISFFQSENELIPLITPPQKKKVFHVYYKKIFQNQFNKVLPTVRARPDYLLTAALIGGDARDVSPLLLALPPLIKEPPPVGGGWLGTPLVSRLRSRSQTNAVANADSPGFFALRAAPDWISGSSFFNPVGK